MSIIPTLYAEIFYTYSVLFKKKYIIEYLENTSFETKPCVTNERIKSLPIRRICVVKRYFSVKRFVKIYTVSVRDTVSGPRQ